MVYTDIIFGNTKKRGLTEEDYKDAIVFETDQFAYIGEHNFLVGYFRPRHLETFVDISKEMYKHEYGFVRVDREDLFLATKISLDSYKDYFQFFFQVDPRFGYAGKINSVNNRIKKELKKKSSKGFGEV